MEPVECKSALYKYKIFEHKSTEDYLLGMVEFFPFWYPASGKLFQFWDTEKGCVLTFTHQIGPLTETSWKQSMAGLLGKITIQILRRKKIYV